METLESLTLSNNHKYVYTTYKELSSLMPRNYLKLKVLPYQKYSISKGRIIDLIETKYNPIKISNTKENLNNEKLKKSIYLFTNNNISEKDLLFSKILSKDNNSRNSSELNFSNINSKFIKTSKNNSVRKKGIFNSSPVKNYFLRNNIRLPEITQRMKKKIPRNERETNGFKVIGNENEENYRNQMKKKDKKYFTVEKKNIKLNHNYNYDNKFYCLSENNDKKINFNKIHNLPLNIVSIVNKNKHTKYNFY